MQVPASLRDRISVTAPTPDMGRRMLASRSYQPGECLFMEDSFVRTLRPDQVSPICIPSHSLLSKPVCLISWYCNWYSE
jgi:hypothetical protein